MGRVRNLRLIAGASLIALAALLVLFASGDSATEATSYTPLGTVRVADPTPNMNSNVTISTSVQIGDAMFSSLDYVSFIPPGWNIEGTDAAIPDGSIAGSALAAAKLGAFNAFCGVVTLPAIVAFLEATTNTAGPTTTFEDDTADADATGEWFEDPSGAVLPPAAPPDLRVRAAVTKYPANLIALFPQPRLRYFGFLDAAGTNVGVNLLIFNPGDLAGLGFSADKGSPVVLTIQRLGDPLAPGDPTSVLTAFCAPFSAAVTINGLASFNPFTGGAPFAPVSQIRNPGPGTYNFLGFSRSQRDADNDTYENGEDTCPITTNVDTSSRQPGSPAPAPPTSLLIAAGPPPVPSTQDPDGWIDLSAIGAFGPLSPFVYPGSNPFIPAFTDLPTSPFDPFPFNVPSDISAPEGIDSSCDPGPASPCGASPLDDGFAQDCDQDGFRNRTDNCPLVANGLVGGVIVPSTQLDTDGVYGVPAVDDGPVTDSIGDACDSGGPAPGLSATVPNGHYHLSNNPQGGSGPICITTPVDTCGPIDTAGVAPAITPGAPPGTPYPLSVFLSTAVTIGNHGVKLLSTQGAVLIAGAGAENYDVKVRNSSHSEADGFRIGLRVTPLSAGCPVPTISGPAGTVVTTTATNVSARFDQAALSVPANTNATETFTVTYGTCSGAGGSLIDYQVTSDACHRGDPSPRGLFNVGTCGSATDTASDNVPSDDVPKTMDVDDTTY